VAFCNVWKQELNHGRKVEGDQGLGPNTGPLAPRAGPKAELGVGCGRGSPFRYEGPGYHPRKIFVNSDAKSCIYTCCEISCFLKTTAKKLRGGNTLLVPQPKVGTSLPRSLRLLRLFGKYRRAGVRSSAGGFARLMTKNDENRSPENSGKIYAPSELKS